MYKTHQKKGKMRRKGHFWPKVTQPRVIQNYQYKTVKPNVYIVKALDGSACLAVYKNHLKKRGYHYPGHKYKGQVNGYSPGYTKTFTKAKEARLEMEHLRQVGFGCRLMERGLMGKSP